ncbi:MAG: PF20097 family protein [Deltaproteobacteria bacterium]
MRCPNCDAEMEIGELDLKAWGIGAFPQAQLHFNNERLFKNTYVTVVGLFTSGTKAPACRCPKCKIVCFKYAAHTPSSESAGDGAKA